ncbi:hypothetical protein N7457_000272 [Penicillium paradoxum]|uniref:uncharacterized protein n=1 Tax=Penicillium paradoxum TaxID=176176 RepID=UPI0025465BB0|nr:uncharacterized protein N7457_000272 [Penicillium paradoxum]KAJ5793673.1 hypothetical protein N7457_000272 [Penicillium paradoxum]
MALRKSAENAEDVAAAFTTFRTPLPEHAAEVTSLIADLYAISSSLATLEDLTKDPRYRRNVALIRSDLNILRASLNHTLEDILESFRSLDGGKASPVGYKRTWMTLNRFFYDESNYSLATRLTKYNIMLKELSDLTKNNHHDSPLFAGLQKNMKTLLAVQDRRLNSRMGRMTLGRNPSSSGSSAGPSSPIINDRRTPRRRSYERTRPVHMSPPEPMSPSSGTFSDLLPSAPSVPGSPVTSTTATTATSYSAISDVIKEHWAKESFTSNSTNNPLPAVRERSRCDAVPQPGIREAIKEKGYEELLQIALNDESDMRVSFYLRESDHRVRILCKVPHRGRPSDYWCLPLNLLEVLRNGSCLRLCRRRNGGTELVLWAQLKFTTMEDLVNFHSTFLALRSQDAGHPVGEILDHEIQDEEELFGGKISDDGYMHALRVFEDLDTGAVRLQASVHEGGLKRTPVWTAFITHNIGKRSWLRYHDSRTLMLRDTKAVVFMSAEDYSLPQTPQGHLMLTFTSSADAKEFIKVVDEIAEDHLR